MTAIVLNKPVGGKRKLEAITVYITKEVKESLEAKAAKEERSVSWIVAKLIEKQLQEQSDSSEQ
jgi:predicted DNA-binding protein